MLVDVIIIVTLTILTGIFAGAESAVLALRKGRLSALLEEKKGGAKAVHRLRQKPERFIATVQIGITVCGATAAAFGGAHVSHELGAWFYKLGAGPYANEIALALVIVVVSFLALVIGALVPKSLALRYSERYSLAVSPMLLFLGWIARPLVWLLLGASNLLLRLFGDRTTFTEARISPEELQQMVEEAAQAGTLDPRVGDIASRVFDFENLRLSSVMVPKRDIIAVRRHAPTEEVLQMIAEHGHSRIPVYEGSVDRIVGYVVAQDVVTLSVERALLVLEDILRPAYYVPESMAAVDCLRGMQKRRMQMAIVLDEHGGVAGLVTIEDLMEELVGPIVSEREAPSEDITLEVDGAAVVVGTTPIREVNRRLNTDLNEDAGYETIAGLCIHLAGWIPTTGAKLIAGDGTEIEVVDANVRRVEKVRVRPPRKTTTADEATPPAEAGEAGKG